MAEADRRAIEAAMMERARAVEAGQATRPDPWHMMHAFLLETCDGDLSGEPPSIDLLDFMVALRMEARSSFTELHLARFLGDGRRPVRRFGISKRAALAMHGELAHLDAHSEFMRLFQRRIPRRLAEHPIHRNITVWLLLRKLAYSLNHATEHARWFDPEWAHAQTFFAPAATVYVLMPSGRHLVVTHAEAAALLAGRRLAGDVEGRLEALLAEVGAADASRPRGARNPLAGAA